VVKISTDISITVGRKTPNLSLFNTFHLGKLFWITVGTDMKVMITNTLSIHFTLLSFEQGLATITSKYR
jgi:hypothetical protein